MYDGRAESLSEVQRGGGFSHLFDFPLAFALRESICGGASLGNLGTVLFADREYADASRLVTFVDNHDLPRLMSVCSLPRAKLALASLFLLRGTPALLYGTEAGLVGEREPDNRGDMRFPPQGSPELYAHVRALSHLRAAHPALAHGSTRLVGFDGDVLLLARESDGERVLVALNNRDVERGVPLFGPSVKGCMLRDLQSGAKEDLGAARVPASGFRAWSLGAETCAVASASSVGPREVELVVRGASSPELLVAGSGAELGRWNPQQAVRLALKPDGSYAARLTLPAGGLFAYKLVGRDTGGALHWEQGDNRYLLVAEGREPLRVAVQARALQ